MKPHAQGLKHYRHSVSSSWEYEVVSGLSALPSTVIKQDKTGSPLPLSLKHMFQTGTCSMSFLPHDSNQDQQPDSTPDLATMTGILFPPILLPFGLGDPDLGTNPSIPCQAAWDLPSSCNKDDECSRGLSHPHVKSHSQLPGG